MSSKRSSLLIATAAVLLVVTAFGAGFIAYPFLAPRLASSPRPAAVQTTLDRDTYLKLSGSIYDTLSLQYYQKVDATKLLKGEVAGLGDPYTELFTPSEAATFREELSGEYVGIGVVITANKDASAIEIVRVFSGTPAEKAGLKPGDVITVRRRENLLDYYRELAGENSAEPNDWLTFDAETLRVSVLGNPGPSDISLPVDVKLVVEFLSR